MKKVVSISLVLLMSIALTGCFKKKTPPVENTVINPPVDEVVEPTAGMYNEYQLDVDIISTDADGVEYGVKTKMYKKGDKSLYVIEEMTGPQELPFTPTQNLLVGTDLYSNIQLNGESMWFKAADVQDQADAMFDLGKMQEQVLAQTEGTQASKEEIDGTMMDCYAIVETGGKICLLDGVFAYGEDNDPTSGMKSVIRVSNYSDKVDENIFQIPNEDEVKDMSEFMQIMMEQLQAEGADVAIVPEDEIAAPAVVPDAEGVVDTEVVVEAPAQ